MFAKSDDITQCSKTMEIFHIFFKNIIHTPNTSNIRDCECLK